ncbi:unnamed protein product [Arabis nemorensis]|uniref:Serine-threonine/tyrosine-protein kinase catalytic domain-containing protein n=1 Tax=Arabis nemorensis TaxID=586526 RepID=A0A565B138_9BRAS|nr:unnamed protein product [Arabis nemorensis]
MEIWFRRNYVETPAPRNAINDFSSGNLFLGLPYESSTTLRGNYIGGKLRDFVLMRHGSGRLRFSAKENNQTSQGHREWLPEVIILGQWKHPRLVNFIGYCCEDDQMLLVYKYMEQGNLKCPTEYCGALPWLTRVKILPGAAKGLG